MLTTPGRGEGEESCNAEESTRTSSEKQGSDFPVPRSGTRQNSASLLLSPPWESCKTLGLRTIHTEWTLCPKEGLKRGKECTEIDPPYQNTNLPGPPNHYPLEKKFMPTQS